MQSPEQFLLSKSPSKPAIDKANQIYSIKFSKLLESLIKILKQFQKKIFNTQESSNYSKQMVITAINIITILLEQNNKDYWANNDNRKSFKEQFDILNCVKGTFVPDVFNEQSLQLAIIILDMLNAIQQEIDQEVQDVGVYLMAQSRDLIVNLVGIPADFIQSLIDYLQCNINFYHAQKAHALSVKTTVALQESINEFFNYCHNNIKAIKPDNFLVFFKEYSAVVKSIMNDINILPYFIITNKASCINQQEPYIFESKDIELSDCRRALICQLINEEYQLSLKMQTASLPLLTTVYDAYQAGYVQQESELIVHKFTQFIKEFKSKADVYKKGEHLGFFQSVDAEKVKLLDRMLNQVSELDESKNNVLDIGSKCISIYKFSLDAAMANAIVSLSKKSPGEFSRVVNSIGLQFFAIVINEISETNDVKVKHELDNVCKLYRPPIIGAETETRIPQKEIDRFLPNVINHLSCNNAYMQFPVCDQTIVALLQHPRCTGELIRRNAQFFRDLLTARRFERILLNVLFKPNKEKIMYTQFWRNYLAILSCDVMSQSKYNEQGAKAQIAHSPAKTVHQQFSTSVDSPVKSSPQRAVVNVHEKCYMHIAELVNSNVSGFLTADTIISVLMLYANQFEDIIDAQVSSKFDLFIEVMNQLVRQKITLMQFVSCLQNSIKMHISRLVNDFEKNDRILFMLLTLIPDSDKSTTSSEDVAKIYVLKNSLEEALTKKPEAIVQLLKKFGNELTGKLKNGTKTTHNIKYLIDEHHNVFASLLFNINLCKSQLTHQDFYCLAHNLTLRQTIIYNPSYLDILLQHDQCHEILNYQEIENVLGIIKSSHLLSPVNLIKLISVNTKLADLILSDMNCMTHLLNSAEFNISLMRKCQEKIVAYLNKSNKNIVEEFSTDIYLKLLATRIILVKENLFSNVKIALKILTNKINDAQFFTLYKNDFVKLLSHKEFCLNLNAEMLAALLLAFDQEELPTEFAQIAHHNPELIKSIGNRNLNQHWVLYEPIYTTQAKDGTLSQEQLILLMQSTDPRCKLWLGGFYGANNHNKNRVRLLLNDADAVNVAQNFPFYWPILDNEPVTNDDLEKFYAANMLAIDNALAAPTTRHKTSVFLQIKLVGATREYVCQRIHLFAFLANNKEFCINILEHLPKFFSEEGHTTEQVKGYLYDFFKDNPNLINHFLTKCDLNIINQNIQLFIHAISSEQFKLDNENLIKLSYCSHPAVHLYLYKDKDRFELVQKHLPIDTHHIMMMLDLIINNQGNHLLMNEKVVLRLVCKVTELFNDFSNNSKYLVALFKNAATRMLFAQLGPNELCKLLTIDNEEFIHDVITTYRHSLIFLIGLQQIRFETANTSLIKTILLDRLLRDQFFNQAIVKELLQQQLYDLYKRNDEFITRRLLEFHQNKMTGFNLRLLSGEQLRDLYFGQNNTFMLIVKNELFQNPELRKLFIPALSAEQKRQYLFNYLLSLSEDSVAEYFAVDADINWLCEGPDLFNLIMNNLAFANYVLQHEQLREIFNFTPHYFTILMKKLLKNKQQFTTFMSKWANNKFITSAFIEAIKFGQCEQMLIFLNNAELVKALDHNEIKIFIESYSVPYLSWNKFKLGLECQEKLGKFCKEFNISLIKERDIIKTMNNVAFDFDRNVSVLTKLSHYSADPTKRKRDLINQISSTISELSFSFNNLSFDTLNKRFELLICLSELLQYVATEFDRKITEQVGLFCKELLEQNVTDETQKDKFLFNLLIKKCLIQTYQPGVFSLILSHREVLIDIGLICTDKKLAQEFLFNPLLCQFLSAEGIAAIVNSNHAFALSCFAHPHIFCVLVNNRDAFVTVAKQAGIIGNDDNDKIFRMLKEISTIISCEKDLLKAFPEISIQQSVNNDLRISPPVVKAAAKLNVFVERAASEPLFDRNSPSPVLPDRRGSSDVVRPTPKSLISGSPSAT